MPKPILLSSSPGEALDKLSILQIKSERLEGAKRETVKREREALSDVLTAEITTHEYHYRILLDINRSIWTLQEALSEARPSKSDLDTFRSIFDHNQRRFRVKRMIDSATGSPVVEEKGYRKTGATYMPWPGLGDLFMMNGAVRYLRTRFDRLTVIIRPEIESNAKLMFGDMDGIVFRAESDYPENWLRLRRSILSRSETLLITGVRYGKPMRDYPLSYYDDLEVPRSARTVYFHCPTPPEARSLNAMVRRFAPEGYILVHQEASHSRIDLLQRVLRNSRYPVFDVNRNLYDSDHELHPVAQALVNLPLPFYKLVLEGATELHLIDSAVHAFATHLDLKGVATKRCYLAHWDTPQRLGVFDPGPAEDYVLLRGGQGHYPTGWRKWVPYWLPGVFPDRVREWTSNNL